MTQIRFSFYRWRNWGKEDLPKVNSWNGRMVLNWGPLTVEPLLFTTTYSFGDGPRVAGKAQGLLKWLMSSWMASDCTTCERSSRTLCRVSQSGVLLPKGQHCKCVFIPSCREKKAWNWYTEGSVRIVQPLISQLGIKRSFQFQTRERSQFLIIKVL